MDIKRGNNIILSIPINKGSKRKYTLQQEDYILLMFSLATPVQLRVGDYVDEDGLFELIDEYKPKHNITTGGYDYELQLDAYYRKWKNKILKYISSNKEVSFSLTAKLDVHLGIVLSNLQALGYKYGGLDFVFSIDNTVENSAKLITYDKINILDALSTMAEAYGCEYWVTENIIHFGKCEFGTAVEFEEGVNVEEMSVEKNNSTHATRIYAFGGDRNIPTNYRPDTEQAVVNGVVQKRLMLPSDTPYIDVFTGMTTEEAIEDVVFFDYIYPRRVGTVSSLSTIEYTDTVENEDGTTTQTQWNAYRFKDAGINFSKDYIIAGKELRIKFESGLLNGMEFAVTFNPDGKAEKIDNSWNSEAQVWEIVRNEDYGRKLPDDTLKPANGDTFVLSGFDTSFVSDTYIPLAEQELKTKAQKYANKVKIDANNYPCKMMYDADSDFYDVGQKVKLVNTAYFGSEGRQSRIIGFEYNLDIPYDHPIYTVGESVSYSRLSNIESNIETLTFKGQVYFGNSGNGVYLIRQNDVTPASDNNTYSALRSQKEFANKLKADIFAEIMTFAKGLISKDPINVGEGAVDSMTAGIGTIITPNKIQADTIEARFAAIFKEVIFNRQSAQEGDTSFSDNGLVETVTLESDGTYTLKLRKRWENDFTSFQEQDILYGIVNNLSTSGSYYTSWVRVASVNTAANAISVIVYPDDEVPGGKNHIPEVLMKLVRRGNATNTARQSYWYLSATTDKCFVWLEGVDKPILEESNYYMMLGRPAHLSLFDNLPINYDQALIFARAGIFQNIFRVKVDGNPVKDILPGVPWVQGTTYKSSDTEADTVWHYGCRWQCIVDETTQEPKYSSTDWAMIEGNPTFTVEIESSNLYEFGITDIADGNVFTTLSVKGTIFNRDCTDDILDADVSWTRDSGNVSEDNTWAALRASAGKSLALTKDDLGIGYPNIKSMTYKVTVTLRDGQTAENEIIIN